MELEPSERPVDQAADPARAPEAGWTAALVAERLVAQFKQSQVTGDWAGVIRLADHLGRGSPECRTLATWASLRASGASIGKLCRQKGVARSTYEDRLRRLLQQVADGLNDAGVPVGPA